MQNRKVYYASIDLLRIIAASAIAFMYHYGVLFFARPYGDSIVMNELYTYAYVGVELFFAISGFVICGSNTEKIIDGSESIGQFMKKRILRIYPVMILTVLVAAAGQWVCYACTAEFAGFLAI